MEGIPNREVREVWDGELWRGGKLMRGWNRYENNGGRRPVKTAFPDGNTEDEADAGNPITPQAGCKQNSEEPQNLTRGSPSSGDAAQTVVSLLEPSKGKRSNL